MVDGNNNLAISCTRLVSVRDEADNVSYLEGRRVRDKTARVLGLLAIGMVTGTTFVFVEYELVVTQRQLFVGKLG